MWFTPPELLVTVSEYVPFGVPGMCTLLLLPPQALMKRIETRAREYTMPILRPSALGVKLARKVSRRSASSNGTTHHWFGIGGQFCGSVLNTIIDGAMVAMVTWKVTGKDPSSATEVGRTVHVANKGAPAQVNVTVPVKPFRGETCRL